MKMRVGFDLTIRRTKLPRKFWRRIAFHNSKIRFDVSGWSCIEHIWCLGYEINLHWGSKICPKKDQKSSTSKSA